MNYISIKVRSRSQILRQSRCFDPSGTFDFRQANILSSMPRNRKFIVRMQPATACSRVTPCLRLLGIIPVPYLEMKSGRTSGNWTAGAQITYAESGSHYLRTRTSSVGTDIWWIRVTICGTITRRPFPASTCTGKWEQIKRTPSAPRNFLKNVERVGAVNVTSSEGGSDRTANKCWVFDKGDQDDECSNDNATKGAHGIIVTLKLQRVATAEFQAQRSAATRTSCQLSPIDEPPCYSKFGGPGRTRNLNRCTHGQDRSSPNFSEEKRVISKRRSTSIARRWNFQVGHSASPNDIGIIQDLTEAL
ncbi:hypothetical protein V8E55_003745 [Tylopilus felleus]